MTRRETLKGTAAAIGGLAAGALGGWLGPAGSALADKAVETGQFVFPRLQYTSPVHKPTSDYWDGGLDGDVGLRRQLRALSNINVSMEPKVVRLGDFDEMCRNPFAFMTGDGEFRLPENEQQNLREFLERGGFMMVDDCVDNAPGAVKDQFFQCYAGLVNRLFPDNPMRKIPYDHEIFHIYFDFQEGCPRVQGVPHGAYGLFEQGTGRIMSWCSAGDIHCGWSGRWVGPEMSVECLKMGINVVIYFLSH